VLNLPGIPGGKKLIYTHLDIPLIALDDLADHATGPKGDPMYAELADIVAAHNGLWNAEAEKLLLARAPRVAGG